ncbi:MAG: extracellular solute-binding protein [Hydrotalea sp.]|nr:extracellular solute-binding protein [Hydrotalea sp.]
MTQVNYKQTTSRRSTIALMGGLLLGTALLAANVNVARAQNNVLHLYNWTDYTSPEFLAKFTKETGIKVQLDTYDSNETLLAKIKSGGGSGYDVFVPSENFLPIFIKQGLVQKVDIKNMPNYKYIDKKWRNPVWDPTHEYHVPYQYGITSFAYRSSLYKGPADSWKEFFEPDDSMKGKIAVFKSPDDVIGSASAYLGIPLCSENAKDYQKIQELLMKQKPFVKVYSSEQVNERLKSGEVVMTHNWDGNTKRAQIDEGITDAKLAFPKEGVVGFFDTVVISSKAPNPEAAKKFLNFLMDPKNMALISNAQGYNNAIPDSYKYFSPTMKKAQALKLPAGYKISFPAACSATAIKYRDKVWTALQK